jgi:hypothetical protein
MAAALDENRARDAPLVFVVERAGLLPRDAASAVPRVTRRQRDDDCACWFPLSVAPPEEELLRPTRMRMNPNPRVLGALDNGVRQPEGLRLPPGIYPIELVRLLSGQELLKRLPLDTTPVAAHGSQVLSDGVRLMEGLRLPPGVYPTQLVMLLRQPPVRDGSDGVRLQEGLRLPPGMYPIQLVRLLSGSSYEGELSRRYGGAYGQELEGSDDGVSLADGLRLPPGVYPIQLVRLLSGQDTQVGAYPPDELPLTRDKRLSGGAAYNLAYNRGGIPEAAPPSSFNFPPTVAPDEHPFRGTEATAPPWDFLPIPTVAPSDELPLASQQRPLPAATRSALVRGPRKRAPC